MDSLYAQRVSHSLGLSSWTQCKIVPSWNIPSRGRKKKQFICCFRTISCFLIGQHKTHGVFTLLPIENECHSLLSNSWKSQNFHEPLQSPCRHQSLSLTITATLGIPYLPQIWLSGYSQSKVFFRTRRLVAIRLFLCDLALEASWRYFDAFYIVQNVEWGSPYSRSWGLHRMCTPRGAVY